MNTDEEEVKERAEIVGRTWEHAHPHHSSFTPKPLVDLQEMSEIRNFLSRSIFPEIVVNAPNTFQG